MNTERDWGENESLLICPWHPKVEYHLKRVLKVNSFSDAKDGTEQNRNMKHPSPTNQSSKEDLDSQDMELENDTVEDDSELTAIATQLQKTASYSINPTFKEELRKKILQQFLEHYTGETNDRHG
jgi:hypothetical protein